MSDPRSRTAAPRRRAFGRALVTAATRAAGVVRDLARGAAGTHAYEQYVAHCRTHHPEVPVLSREDFFRREFSAKWEGIRRCC